MKEEKSIKRPLKVGVETAALNIAKNRRRRTSIRCFLFGNNAVSSISSECSEEGGEKDRRRGRKWLLRGGGGWGLKGVT